MSKYDGTPYRSGRVFANLTQEQASELLNIGVRSISDWERGESLPNDDIVILMAKVYGDKNLPYRHLKANTPFAEYIPDYVEPENNGDMAFQGIIATKEIARAAESLTSIMEDGKLTIDEYPLYGECMARFKAAGNKALSIEAYGKSIKVEK